MVANPLGQSGESHLRTRSAHQNAERNVPDLSRRHPGTGKSFFREVWLRDNKRERSRGEAWRGFALTESPLTPSRLFVMMNPAYTDTVLYERDAPTFARFRNIPRSSKGHDLPKVLCQKEAGKSLAVNVLLAAL
jgi:hypothetical protein